MEFGNILRNQQLQVYQAVGRMFLLSTMESEMARHAQEANEYRVSGFLLFYYVAFVENH